MDTVKIAPQNVVSIISFLSVYESKPQWIVSNYYSSRELIVNIVSCPTLLSTIHMWKLNETESKSNVDKKLFYMSDTIENTC